MLETATSSRPPRIGSLPGESKSRERQQRWALFQSRGQLIWGAFSGAAIGDSNLLPEQCLHHLARREGGLSLGPKSQHFYRGLK